jgi:TonB family protein
MSRSLGCGTVITAIGISGRITGECVTVWVDVGVWMEGARVMRSVMLFATLAAAIVGAVPARSAAQAPATIPPPARLVPLWLAHPTYPQIAQSARVQGVVIVDVEVDPDGHVASSKVTRSIPLLDKAVLEAVNETYFICEACGTASQRRTLAYEFRFGDESPRPADISAERIHFVVAAPEWPVMPSQSRAN